MSRIDANEIKRLVLERMPDAEVSVRAYAGDDHFEMSVTSRAFAGLSRVAQHQMVYAALGEHMKEAIHALRLKTMVKK